MIKIALTKDHEIWFPIETVGSIERIGDKVTIIFNTSTGETPSKEYVCDVFVYFIELVSF